MVRQTFQSASPTSKLVGVEMGYSTAVLVFKLLHQRASPLGSGVACLEAMRPRGSPTERHAPRRVDCG
jgi:hypothetical protein